MKKVLILSLLVLFLSPALVFAQLSDADRSSTVVDSPEEVEATIKNIADWLFRIFMTLAVIMLIIASFQFLFAQGDTEKFATAKRTLVYTIVAVAVAVLSSGIVKAIEMIIKQTAG